MEKLFAVKQIPLTSMLSFVIMAENFNNDSPYIKKIVSQALVDIDNHGQKQKKLLVCILDHK